MKMQVGTPEQNVDLLRHITENYTGPKGERVSREMIAEVVQAGGRSTVDQWFLSDSSPHKNALRGPTMRLILLEMGLAKPAFPVKRKPKAARK